MFLENCMLVIKSFLQEYIYCFMKLLAIQVHGNGWLYSHRYVSQGSQQSEAGLQYDQMISLQALSSLPKGRARCSKHDDITASVVDLGVGIVENVMQGIVDVVIVRILAK
jgi:hypothetical protein